MKQSDWLVALPAVTRQNPSPASMLFTLNLFLTDFFLSLPSALFPSVPVKMGRLIDPLIWLMKNPTSLFSNPHPPATENEYFTSTTADMQTGSRPISVKTILYKNVTRDVR